MKNIEVVRQAQVQRLANYNATPTRRIITEADKATISVSALERLPVAGTTPVQNADGTFPTLTGYDW